MRKNGVQALLMGGQACVFYGAAEFSRDLDLLILVDAANLIRLRQALDELDAKPIAVPPFTQQFLEAGHAIHFRCRRPDVAGLRIDLAARLRAMGGFEEIWQRRTQPLRPKRRPLTCWVWKTSFAPRRPNAIKIGQ